MSTKDYEIVQFVQNLLTHARMLTGDDLSAGRAVRSALRSNSKSNLGRIPSSLAVDVLRTLGTLIEANTDRGDSNPSEDVALSLNTLFGLDADEIREVLGGTDESLLDRLHNAGARHDASTFGRPH